MEGYILCVQECGSLALGVATYATTSALIIYLLKNSFFPLVALT